MRKSTNLKASLAYEAPVCELMQVSENAGFCVSTNNPFDSNSPWDSINDWE